MRFNLHNSIGHFPVSADIFEHLLPYGKSELSRELDDFEAIQATRTDRLKEKYSGEIEKLKQKKVVFLGDSISSDNLGYRISVTRAASLDACDGTISGGTSSMILHDAKMLVQNHKPDIVSLMIGANDSVSIDGLPQVSMAEYERNIRTMVTWAKESGAAVLLFEITPIIADTFEKNASPQYKSQTIENIRAYNRILKKIADDNQIGLLSNEWLLDQREMFEPDGIHLSLKGQEQFAENWLVSAAKLQ